MAQFENNDHVPTSFGEQKFKVFFGSSFLPMHSPIFKILEDKAKAYGPKVIILLSSFDLPAWFNAE